MHETRLVSVWDTGIRHTDVHFPTTDLVALRLEAAVGRQPYVLEARVGDGVVPERQPCHGVVVPDLRVHLMFVNCCQT
jgi:hypothetical protein